ncbi:MAG: ComEC/Rec2 family competence protein [Candidatus Pacebacteria bacterium]|nr:ComEC/Rec2 family competence protein [Candidatus Paceibacterota bacterium]
MEKTLLVFMAGILFASFFDFSGFVFLILGLGLIGVWNNKRFLVSLGLALIVFGLAVFYFDFRYSELKSGELSALADNSSIVLTGIVSKEPQTDYDRQKMTISVLENEKILVSVPVFPQYDYGDRVEIKGKFRKPGMIEDFDYEGFLLKDGIIGYMSFPEINVLEKNQGNGIIAFVYSFKKKMISVMEKNLSLEKEAILEATILGNTLKMGDELKEKLSLSGLNHAIAISGAHIVLFAGIIFELFLIIGLWRNQALLASIFFILFYVFFVGMPASAVWAGFMVSLIFLAQILGRRVSNLRTLIMAGFLILLFNPLVLRYDLGFQLSFFATLGIVLLGPVFNYWLRPFVKFKALREILAMTLSAQVLVLPILSLTFGYFSLVSLLSSVLVFPALPIIMILGLLFPLLGLVSSFLSWLLAMLCSLFLSYLVLIIDFCSLLPFSRVETPLVLFFLIYLPLLFFLVSKKREGELDFFL